MGDAPAARGSSDGDGWVEAEAGEGVEEIEETTQLRARHEARHPATQTLAIKLLQTTQAVTSLA